MAKRKRVSLTKARIDAEILRQTLAGYAQVNQITAGEHRARARAPAVRPHARGKPTCEMPSPGFGHLDSALRSRLPIYSAPRIFTGACARRAARAARRSRRNCLG